MTAINGKPRHAPFAQETAERLTPADSHRLPPPPCALPYGEAYAALIAREQSALVDAVIEHAVGPAADALLERIEARFDALDRRLIELEARIFGDPSDATADSRPATSDPCGACGHALGRHTGDAEGFCRDCACMGWAPQGRDERPQPRRPDSPPQPDPHLPEDDPAPESDPGPAQTPPPADDPHGEEHLFDDGDPFVRDRP